MEDIFIFLWVVLPIVITVGVIVLVVVIGSVIKARVSAVSRKSFEKLANDLKDESEKIRAELTAIKESVGSIDKMMKEIG
jgi:peptidoglycan hydrolase CwlO-like protein